MQYKIVAKRTTFVFESKKRKDMALKAKLPIELLQMSEIAYSHKLQKFVKHYSLGTVAATLVAEHYPHLLPELMEIPHADT